MCGDPAAMLPDLPADAAAAATSNKYAEEVAKLKVVAPTAATLVRTQSDAPPGRVQQAAAPRAAAATMDASPIPILNLF